MADDLTLRRLVNTGPMFYRILGPFLSRRAVVRETGGPIWDDDDKRWYVALHGGTVVGFCAARDANTHVMFQSAYTLPGWRRRGVCRTLATEWMRDWSDRPSRAVCTPAMLPLLLSFGFTAVRTRGTYTEVRRNDS